MLTSIFVGSIINRFKRFYQSCTMFFEEESSSDSRNEFFNKLGQQIVLNVLNENLDTLEILKLITGWSEGDQIVVEYKTVEEQCNTIKNDDVLVPESKDSVDLSDFRKGCAFIESTIRKTFNEIREKGTYRGLAALTNIFQRLQKEETELLEDAKIKESEYEQLRNTYYNERLLFKREIHDMMIKIGNLKDEIEDFEQETNIKKRYLASWANSNAEMGQYVLMTKKSDLMGNIKERQHNFTKEERVHQEIRNIFNEIEMDLQKQLKKWQMKYEHDYTSVTSKINSLHEKKERQQEKNAEMVKKYVKRQQDIDSYLEHKMELEKKRADKQRKDKAATKIQAWWRGTMVRKGFGKFKKKDKKGKKKTDNTKK